MYPLLALSHLCILSLSTLESSLYTPLNARNPPPPPPSPCHPPRYTLSPPPITLSPQQVYFIRGNLTISTDYNRANVRDASSVVLMADRDNLAQVDDEDLDAVTLFTYLKLTGHIPASVFFTAELTFESNMVVLNRHIMQHRMDKEEDGAKQHNVRNKSFLTVKGRISGFTDYSILEIEEQIPLIGAERTRQQSFIASMKEGVRRVGTAGMGALRTSSKDNLDDSTGQHQTTVATTSAKPKSTFGLFSTSQRRSSHKGTVAVVESSSGSLLTRPTPLSSDNDTMPSLVPRRQSMKPNSANSSAKNTPRQHNSVTNPLLRQASSMMARLPEGMSPRTPERSTNHVEAEIGPVVEVHELPVFASGRAFVPGRDETTYLTPLTRRMICTSN